MANQEQLELLLRSVEEWNQWREENPKVEIDIRYVDLSEVSLRKANLRDADLSETNLRYADLRGTDLSFSYLIEADLGFSDLSDANLSDANLSGTNLIDADLSGADLSGANLSNANLGYANLVEADLSGADLSGAILSNANISDVRFFICTALGTNFSYANLTGACIQDWHINQRTIFEGVICDYIYYELGERRTYQERRPRDPNKIFNAGDFQRLIETARETVDLIFSDGIDWKAFLESFNALQVEDGQGTLSVKTIEQKDDGSFVIRVKTSANAEQFEKRFYQKYNKLLQQARYYYQKLQLTEHDIQSYQRENANLMKIIELQASQPMINANNIGAVNTGQIIGDNNKFAGILNEAEQQNLTEIITEVQAIIAPLAQTYPNDKTMQGIKTIEVIKNDPNLKQKLINAAQKGGLEFVKKSFDNPVGALIGGAIEGWMGK